MSNINDLLYHAIEHGHVEVVNLLREKGAKYSGGESSKVLKFNRYLIKGNKEMIKCLIQLEFPYEKFLNNDYVLNRFIGDFRFNEKKNIITESLEELENE